jgi:serine/threonine-protein kinase
MQLSAGQIVNQRYRIARLLAAGGMGAVYRAWDLVLNIPVALKEMLPDPAMSSHELDDLRGQFRQEAQILAGLKHPSLPRVTDFFVWSGNDYLVMDFVEGESLAAIIERDGSVPEDLAVEWALQLLDALAACHRRNVLHRDIKPQNIIIRDDGRVVLVDFGLVKLWDPKNPRTQQIIRGMGTREYASPEQFGLQRGAHTEPRSDVYSLGATLYHALTGCEPPSAMDRLVNETQITSPQSMGAAISPRVEAVVMQSLSLQRERRFGSVEAMRRALSASIGGAPPAREYPTPLPPTERTSSVPVSQPHWSGELIAAEGLALVATLSLQAIAFLDITPPERFAGLTVGALIIGALGWFIGDIVHQALTMPDTATVVGSTAPGGGGRPTQRLVAGTRKLMRQMTPAQQIGLLVLLVIVTAAGAWLLGPTIRDIPWLWNNLPSWAIAAPLIFAATGRRQGLSGVAHLLVSIVGGLVLKASAGTTTVVEKLILGALVGGVLVEVGVFISKRLLRR